MKRLLNTAAAALACLATGATPFAAQASAMGNGEARLADSTELAGQSLQLNGTGFGVRLIFKVYAIALYLPSLKRTTEGVLASQGPRRVVISMLRDVSGSDFTHLMTGFVAAADSGAERARVASAMEQLAAAFSAHVQNLRKGDTLTLDWIPGTGTVVAVNQRPIAEPMQGIAVYNALLNVWLGNHPADPDLKTRLLGDAA